MSIKRMGEELEATIEVRMMKLTTRRNLWESNATSVVKKDIQRLIAQRLKKTKTIMTKT